MKRWYIVTLLSMLCFMGFGGFNSVNATPIIKMSYNGPPDVETNAVHLYAVNFKRYLDILTGGEIQIDLYPNSEFGNEQERMMLVTEGVLHLNVASFAGISPLLPELFASNVPFLFDSYEAARLFFDKSRYWVEVAELFHERTGSYLLQAIEEGGFLAFTNSKRELRHPADFLGLHFRAMDESQKALYESFSAKGTIIPWTETYLALMEEIVDGQMNPPLYVINGNLYEVQTYMTLAKIQYSDQFLVIHGDCFDSLSLQFQEAVKMAAFHANQVNRIEIAILGQQRIHYLAEKGMRIYYPNEEELRAFQEIGQPSYLAWLKEKIDSYWIELALNEADRARHEAQSAPW